LIETLQSHPRWRTRDDAAHELREFDWRCHPEILAALTTAMLTDCENEVREEAAESLAKIQPAPCSPEVHAALARTAQVDRDWCTRKWARKGAARLDGACRSDCGLCELTPTGYASAPPRLPFGRFLLPRNSAYLPPGGRVDLPVSEPMVVPQPEMVEMMPAPRNAELVPMAPEPRLLTPPDPLEELRTIEALPDPSLPRAVNPEPRVPPPPAADGSPFDLRPRAERIEESKLAMRDGQPDDERREARRPQPRRRSLLSGLFGRR
jgi:hypothetical protein